MLVLFSWESGNPENYFQVVFFWGGGGGGLELRFVLKPATDGCFFFFCCCFEETSFHLEKFERSNISKLLLFMDVNIKQRFQIEFLNFVSKPNQLCQF